MDYIKSFESLFEEEYPIEEYINIRIDYISSEFRRLIERDPEGRKFSDFDFSKFNIIIGADGTEIVLEYDYDVNGIEEYPYFISIQWKIGNSVVVGKAYSYLDAGDEWSGVGPTMYTIRRTYDEGVSLVEQMYEVFVLLLQSLI
jgi:hypothetical protein